MTLHRILPAAALAAAFALATAPAHADLKKGWIDYTHGSMKLKGYVVHDDKLAGKRPAILIIHARDGMTAKNQQLADAWAKLGYVTFVADIFGYGQGILPKGVPEMSAQTAIYTNDVPLMRARTRAGYDALLKHPLVDGAKVASIGYCFGGAVGAEFATTGVPLALHVAIHGSFRGHQPGWAKTVKGRYLILHGSEDKGYPIKTIAGVVDELRAASVPFQLELYSGTGHGFSAPKNKDEERANKQSIASTGRALKEVFGL
ncbi:MAG: dienelactone hydrolase family protein [Xanthobacteraceae bacterium]